MKSKAWSNRLTTKHNTICDDSDPQQFDNATQCVESYPQRFDNETQRIDNEAQRIEIVSQRVDNSYNAFTMHWQRVATHFQGTTRLRWFSLCRVFANRVTYHQAVFILSWTNKYGNYQCHSKAIFLYLGPLTLLFAKFTEDRMIHKASRLWNFGWVVFSNFFSLISYITVSFYQSFSIRNFNLLFTLFLIYMNTSGDFPFRQCRVR